MQKSTISVTIPEFNRSPDTALTRARTLVRGGTASLVLGICLPWSLLQSAVVRKILLGIVILDIPLQIGTHLWFQADAAELGALGGFNISVTTIALAGLYAAWLPTLTARRHLGQASLVRLNKPLLVYLGAAFVSILVARDRMLSVFEVGLFVQMFLLYVFIASTITTRGDIRFVTRMLLLGLVVESLLMLLLLKVGTLPVSWLRTRIDVPTDPFEPARVAGTIGSANSAAAYLGVLILFALSVLFSRISPMLKAFAGVALALGTICLIATFSRGGLLATGICSLLLLAFLAGASRKNFNKIVVAIVLLGSIGFCLRKQISERFVQDDRGSAYSRIPLMKLAFRMIEDHPILGVGSNNFGAAMDKYVNSDFRNGFLYAVHNQYLLIWAETGVVGVLSFLWFLTSSIRQGVRCWRQHDPVLSPLALGLSMGLVAFMIHMSVDIFRGRPLAQLVFFVAALISAIADNLATSSSANVPRTN
jgi:O-antigen ligase